MIQQWSGAILRVQDPRDSLEDNALTTHDTGRRPGLVRLRCGIDGRLKLFCRGLRCIVDDRLSALHITHQRDSV
jgi:hypothetical protein